MIISIEQHRRHRTCPEADLRGLGYPDRRDVLFEALHRLRPGESLRIVSDREDDVTWLRFEVETRRLARFGWSLPAPFEGAGARQITVRNLSGRQDEGGNR